MKILFLGKDGQAGAPISAELCADVMAPALTETSAHNLPASGEISGYGFVSNKFEKIIARGMWVPRSINLHNWN